MVEHGDGELNSRFDGAEELLQRFLAGRTDRTRAAYTIDLEDFARFRGQARAEAVLQLLDGPRQARLLALEYAVDLQQRGFAQATIDRRLGTLRSLARMASKLGLVEWTLEIPDAEQVAAAAPRSADDAYILPRHASELDRLDIQHYAMRDALQQNYLAPLDKPVTILDVGCGTGQWAFELCADFPKTLVIGLDLAPSKPGPATYRFVRGNLLQGLPFGEGGFDFVHQRLLQSGVPLTSWPGVVEDLARVTRPGGWVELVEVENDVRGGGPATRRLLGLLMQLAGSRGLDGTGVLFRQLDEYLRNAGLEGVERREVDVPMGAWGGRVGSLMASDLRALYTRLADVFQARLGVSVDECEDLIAEMSRELDEYRTLNRFGVAFGRKPVSASGS